MQSGDCLGLGSISGYVSRPIRNESTILERLGGAEATPVPHESRLVNTESKQEIVPSREELPTSQRPWSGRSTVTTPIRDNTQRYEPCSVSGIHGVVQAHGAQVLHSESKVSPLPVIHPASISRSSRTERRLGGDQPRRARALLNNPFRATRRVRHVCHCLELMKRVDARKQGGSRSLANSFDDKAKTQG